MQFLLDNLTATIVSAVLILSLQFTQARSKYAAMEQSVAQSLKKTSLEFGTALEDDVLDVGRNFGKELYRFEPPDVDPVTGDTDEWRFYSDSTFTLPVLDASGDPVFDADGDPVTKKTTMRIYKQYRLVETETVTFRDSTYQLYALHRDSTSRVYDPDGTAPVLTEAEWAAATPTGQSLPTLTFFQIDLLDRFAKKPDNDPTTGKLDVRKVDYVRIRFGIVPAYLLEQGRGLRELYWVKTLKVRPYWTPPQLSS